MYSSQYIFGQPQNTKRVQNSINGANDVALFAKNLATANQISIGVLSTQVVQNTNGIVFSSNLAVGNSNDIVSLSNNLYPIVDYSSNLSTNNSKYMIVSQDYLFIKCG